MIDAAVNLNMRYPQTPATLPTQDGWFVSCLKDDGDKPGPMS
jgi:hypothetical protein